ncbi:SDR family NAD(P)-dependent oxidoreductase [Paeniglutamicibacter sp. NPDC091659]|uniref:SDR family NAD(P)-dependent oxidoreductase n=1 Tax=Paeniglutamicibacter sp. NPDC091659 TaxID=3364389 RepID=UPI0037FFD7B7
MSTHQCGITKNGPILGDSAECGQNAVGDASGKRILVTGANAGIGFWTSLQLAQRGAEVILACRNQAKADAALQAIRSRVPNANVSSVILDMANLESVAEAVVLLSELDGLDVLIANAGVVHAPRARKQSPDGLELVAATNFFGHFALVAGLLPVLERTPGSRVLTLGSLSTLLVKLRLDDLQLHNGYSGWQAYAQSKIMVQSFGFELDRRLQAAGSPVRALSAHPGYSISGRTPRVPGVNEPSRGTLFADSLQAAFTQGKNRGALAVVRAALDPQAFRNEGAVFFGPRGWVKGAPVRSKPARVTTDSRAAEAIWEEAEKATGIKLLS